ncbi:MAG: autotransporter-associated beta strand repeat-containing protein, partial [Deltaproteobacteria bacterium]|nr:autotransporter-associated beta strand repeat-containing protein [Deltaproteobacteria bacterium]
MKKIIIGASFGVLASLAFVSAAPAATWDGGGTNTNWTTANNWNPNGAPSAGAALSFPSGALKLSNTNDFPDLTGFQSLTFLAANYNLGGNDIQLSNGLLSSQPSGTNILALGIALTQDQSFTVQNSGSFLTINGDIDLKTSTLTVGGAGNLISGGQVLGTGDILKDGPGYFRLTGNNSFSGGITVNAGTLEVNNTAGSGTGSGAVIVESGAKVQGDGEIDGEVLVKSGGKISPGDSQPALLATGNLILDPNAVLIAQVNGNVPDTEYSGLKVTGT